MASPSTLLDWNTVPSASSLISIGTHSLHFSISGPPRQTPNTPLIIIFPGAGDISLSWTPVTQLISPTSRILLYDRSGLGHSNPRPTINTQETQTPHPPPPTAVTAAEELHTLLQVTKLTPPYILCAHSYGAIIAREFLHLWSNEVIGMVLVEGSTERQYQYFQIPDPNISAILGDLNFARVTGLRDEAKIGKEEWRERAKLIAGGFEAANEEMESYVEVCETLGAKRQFEEKVLGERPLSVIRASGKRDYQRIYEAGVEAGNGTMEQRRAFRELLDGWEDVDRHLKEEQLRLSAKSRLVYLRDCGHNVQLLRPDVIAEEIRWVIDSIGRKSVSGSL